MHDDHYPQDAVDTKWLPEVARRGWIILTKDKDIRHRKLELNAVLDNNAYVITFGAGDWNADEMAYALKKALSKLRRNVARYYPPFLAQIGRAGNVVIL